LANIAVSAAVANSITEGMFNTNLIEFLTGRVNGNFRPGADGSNILTLPELLGAGPGGLGGNFGSMRGHTSLAESLTTNFKKNAFKMGVAVVMIPVIGNVATKILRKPVILPANRMLKSVGLKDVKMG
jgi:hypothetical protein